MLDDDAEFEFGGLYENGHWVWDESTDALLFVSDLTSKSAEDTQIHHKKVVTETIQFRDDVDLMEQIRFRRRYQRKLAHGEPDIITLQDVKDIAIYTAPVHDLTPMLINMLHLPSTDRFLRALILCTAYYLQVADEMALRISELDTKVRTPNSEIVESEFRDNLSDLRVCVMLVGGGDTKKFHHMGPAKKLRSLSDKHARLFETFLSLSIQIVWLALGRKRYNQIEVETHRLFKTEIFNIVENNLKTGYVAKMAAEERKVLLGDCVRRDKKLTTRSPLINEVFCDREINCRLMGVGVIKYKPGFLLVLKRMTKRLQYMRNAISAKEEELRDKKMTLGIIGLSRSGFDTMLRPVAVEAEKTTLYVHVIKIYKISGLLQYIVEKIGCLEQAPGESTIEFVPSILLRNVFIVMTNGSSLLNISVVFVPSLFPEEFEVVNPVNVTQRRRWLNRLKKLAK